MYGSVEHEAPAIAAVAMPRPSVAAGGRLAWSVVAGYVRLLCRIAVVVGTGLGVNWAILGLWPFSQSSRIVDFGMAVVFGLLFPLAYLVVGQKQGMQVFLRHCYQRHESSLMDLLLVTLQRLFVAGEHGSSITGASVREALKGAEEMPWPIRFAAKRFLVRGDLQAIALEILADPDLSAGSLASVKERYAARIRDCVLTQIVDVNKRWLWTLAAANGCAGVMAWLLLR